MIGQCTPVRWDKLTGKAGNDGLIKDANKTQFTILIETTDIDLLCWLSTLGVLHRHNETGLILFAASGLGTFYNALSYMRDSYEAAPILLLLQEDNWRSVSSECDVALPVG